MSENQPRKPVDFDELFPGRFIKAGLILGQSPTYQITSVDVEELPQEKGADRDRGIISFRETKLQLALNRTNGECLKAMFGRSAQQWVGKRITLCTEKDRDPGGKGQVDCIRIAGSPDIARDMTIEVKLPRRRPIPRTLKRTGNAPQQKQPPAQQPPPAPKPKGDIEDALQRIHDCPPDELSGLRDELRDFAWTREDGHRIADAFAMRQPHPTSDQNGDA